MNLLLSTGAIAGIVVGAVAKGDVLRYTNSCLAGQAHIRPGLWRRSSVGQSIRFIPEVSPVRIQSPLPCPHYGDSPLARWSSG